MQNAGWVSAIARSGMLAMVASALTAPLALFIGAGVFYLEARLGRIDPRAGFEPNAFLRTFALPLSLAVFVVTFAAAYWHLRRSGS